jgi:hypothetical protein
MDENYIAEPHGLIDLKNLKPNEHLISKLDYPEIPDQILYMFIKDNYLVIHTDAWNPFKKIRDADQEEFPLGSLRWIIDTFDQGFFKKPEEGGLPESIRKSTTRINNELIGINASANCCAKFQPGYDIWNASRKSYINKRAGQVWQVPTYQFTKNGLLDKLKKIADDYEKGLL